jgi:beta-mannanase
MSSAVRTFLAALLVALVVLAGNGGVALTDASSAAQPSQRQTLFGMDVPSLEQLDGSQSVVGVHAAIVGTFADWAHTSDFPSRLAEDVNARGAVLLISWEPWDSWRGGADQPAYALRRIVGGDYDALIDRWADEIARYRRPVMLRFAPEMNGDWLPWSTGVNGNRPGDYVAAWRHVWTRFQRAGATNAVWVWNPIAISGGSTPLSQLFPGSNEVDWLAVDGYNWGSTRDWGWQTYADIFPSTLRAFRALAPGRPVMIAETGSAPGSAEPAWVTNTLQSAHADGVGAVVWFEFDKETDWRLASDPRTAQAARAVVEGPGWRQGGNLPAIERLVTRAR